MGGKKRVYHIWNRDIFLMILMRELNSGWCVTSKKKSLLLLLLLWVACSMLNVTLPIMTSFFSCLKIPHVEKQITFAQNLSYGIFNMVSVSWWKIQIWETVTVLSSCYLNFKSANGIFSIQCTWLNLKIIRYF